MRRIGAAIFVATTFTTAGAVADEEVDSLLKQLREEHAALSTQDCVTACKALASIRRATDRICAIDPGPRCSEARTKADDAQRRVQAACPDCQLAATPPRDEERRAAEAPPPSPAPPQAEPSKVQERKGGCASCSTPGERPTGDLGVLAIGAVVIARVLRRRQRRSV
jgi:hypothetical protein